MHEAVDKHTGFTRCESILCRVTGQFADKPSLKSVKSRTG